MNADRENAPWSASQRRNDNSSVLLISLTVGCLVIGGALLLHHEQLPQSSPPLPAPVSAPAAAAIPPSAPDQLPATLVQRPHYPAAPARPVRQTEFNDQNYQPHSDINVIQSVQPRYSSIQSGPSQRSVVRRSFWHAWSWEFAGKVTGGKFTWLEQAGRINWSSVCSNYKDGSFIYRDCRKAAKVVFAQLCKEDSRSPACAADHHYNPITG